jgi:hypothetical protein
MIGANRRRVPGRGPDRDLSQCPPPGPASTVTRRPVTARGGIPAGRRLRVRPRPRAQARTLAGSRPPESRRGDAARPGCDTSQPENRASEYRALSSNVIHHASSHGRAGAGYESVESESESESPGPQRLMVLHNLNLNLKRRLRLTRGRGQPEDDYQWQWFLFSSLRSPAAP